MKGLVAIFLIVAIVCVVYLFFHAVKKSRRAIHEKLHNQWVVSEPDVLYDGTTQIYIKRGVLVRPFGDPIPGDLPEPLFQERLEDLKVHAEARCEALNRRLSA